MIYISTINYYSEKDVYSFIEKISLVESIKDNLTFVVTDNSSSLDQAQFDSISKRVTIKFLFPNKNLGFGAGHNFSFKAIQSGKNDIFVKEKYAIN